MNLRVRRPAAQHRLLRACVGLAFDSGSLCQEFAVDPDDALFTVTVTSPTPGIECRCEGVQVVSHTSTGDALVSCPQAVPWTHLGSRGGAPLR